jgi:hypothetical protein
MANSRTFCRLLFERGRRFFATAARRNRFAVTSRVASEKNLGFFLMPR